MSNLTTVVNNIISKVNTHTTDLSNKTTQISTHIPLSGITAYHLLQGNLAVSASTITQGFNTTLYTSGNATTGIDMNTQWGNTAEEKFGGLVWLKDRVEATNNFLYDTVRGATKEINSNTTEAETTLASGLTAFNSTGFTVGADTGHNSTTNNMVSWNFQTTHRTSGTTNHGKAYTCHYNPFTGFTIVKYEGSGIAGHEIPHHLGRKLGFWSVKNLSSSVNWYSQTESIRLLLNVTDAGSTNITSTITDDNLSLVGGNLEWNTSSNSYILYGWANSYYDENKLIGNYEIGVYQGTGASGNKVTTRGKPAWIMIKRLNGTSNWDIYDNQRSATKLFRANQSVAEATYQVFDIVNDGFIINYNVTDTDFNASGGQYLYIVAYDTNSNGGGSYYPLASDTSNLQIQNAIIPFANGVDTNGTKITTLSKNETITGLTLTQGKNYVYSKNDGTYGVSKYEPMYGSLRNRSVAGENPDYFDLKTMKWYGTTGGAELVTNGTFDSNTNGWTADFSATLSIYNSTLKVLNSGAYESAYQLLQLTVGKTYTIKMSVAIGDCTSVGFVIRNDTPAGGIAVDTTTGIGTITKTFTAQSQNTYIMLRVEGAAGKYGYFDNISVFEAVPTIGTEITTSRNYLNHIVYADNDGGVLYVEELPKIEYKDTVQVDSLKILSGFDLGQTWKDVTASRSAGVTYTNNTGKPIQVMITTANTDTSNYVFSATVNGVQISYVHSNYTIPYWCFIVPQGHTYSVTSGKALSKWSELR